MSTHNLFPLLPEIFILLMISLTLIMGVFLPKFRHLPYYLAQFTLVVLVLLTAWVYQKAGDGIILSFSHSFILDPLSVVLKFFIYVLQFFVFLYARPYNDERYIPSNEFYVLSLLSTLGMMVLVSAHNLIPLYLGLEILALPTYALVALQHGKTRCIEAAIKYFVMGAIASGIFLYGLSLLFGVTRALDLQQISKIITQLQGGDHLILIFGLVFILAGVAFKLGAVPFHLWIPDVYDGAPSSVTLLISTAPKVATLGLLIRLLMDAMPGLHIEWQQLVLIIALLSIALGNLVAIVQWNIKRMLGYSSIAHIGYMLLGIACDTHEGNAAALFYIVTYAFMTAGAFGIVVLMSRAGLEANGISDFAGLNSRSPWFAFMMLLLMFSLAGVPPIVGFIAKVGILEALIAVHLSWVAVVAIIFAIIGAYYYIHVVKVMYFEEPSLPGTLTCPLDTKIAMSINGLAVLLVGMFPGTLFRLCHAVF